MNLNEGLPAEDQQIDGLDAARWSDRVKRVWDALKKWLRRRPSGRTASRNVLFLGLEILIIVIWTFIVARPYLDMDASMVPAGREFLSAIQTHQVWVNAQECGSCALWFGNIRGGIPAFIDPTASVLHPLVIMTTWIWGVINGSKMALAGVLLIAGVSQWWLGKIMGLRRVTRDRRTDEPRCVQPRRFDGLCGDGLSCFCGSGSQMEP
jgi:hypothetical protein